MCTSRCMATAFAILILFCVYIPRAESDIATERDLVISRISTVDSVLRIDEDVASDVREGVVEQADCYCRNGHCVRNGRNLDCICNPEFAKVPNTNSCQFCFCGAGFNCSFFDRGVDKKCHCPDGFKEGFRRCLAVCNETHPCENGGTCNAGLCICKPETMGDFCETIACDFDCRKSLEVDCLYNHETNQPICLCKNRSLIFDYNQALCRTCPCGNGTCINGKWKSLECKCHEGYKEFNGYCKPCECGNRGKCSIDSNGEKRCKCPDGFMEREGRCIDCNCGSFPEVIKCTLNRNEKICFCPEGFESRYGTCEDIDECKLNNTCYGVKCINTIGSYRCDCEEGYRLLQKYYPEDGCIDINECDEMNKCQRYPLGSCVNLPGTYKCVCRDGYEPTSMWTDPQHTLCMEFQESWLPTIISITVAVVVIILLIVACGVRKYMNYRARQRN